MYNLDWLRANLPKGIPLNFYPELHSTNSEALRLIEEEKIDDNTLLLTGNQTAGRGRLQRTWLSDPADSLIFSLVLRNPAIIPMEHPGLLPLMAGLAACEAIAELTNTSPQVKWPNDVLLNGKKVCGVLAESVWNPPAISGVVIGIGVNVGIESIPPSDQIRYPASSIESETGTRLTREVLLVRILQNLCHWLPLTTPQEFRSCYEKQLAFMGESVNIINEVDQSLLSGICRGINAAGELMLETSNGQRSRITAGEVSLRQKFDKTEQ